MITNDFINIDTSIHGAFCTLQKYIIDKKYEHFLILYTPQTFKCDFLKSMKSAGSTFLPSPFDKYMYVHLILVINDEKGL